jgi:DNA-binding IclR family transcriptional regulator
LPSTPRVLSIVRFLVSSKEPKSLVEISRELNISSSTTFRILSALKEEGWASLDPSSKKYKVGNGFLGLAVSLLSRSDFRNVSLPYLEMLQKKVDEGAMLAIRIGLERMYIDQIESRHELRQVAELGTRMPLWLGGAGKAILAHLGENEMEAVLKQAKGKFFVSGKSMDLCRLRQELNEIRRRGFAVSCGERLPGTNMVAAPIFDRNHQVVGAICVGGPDLRFTRNAAIQCAPLVSKIAKEISFKLGLQSSSANLAG